MKTGIFCAVLLLLPAIALADADVEQAGGEGKYYSASEVAAIDEAARISRAEQQKKNASICDAQGRVQRIEDPYGGYKEFFYHPTLNKISAVATNEVSTVFTYDQAGNLTRIYNTHDQLITLDYDSHKQVRRMVETNKTEHMRRELIFKYNASGKPVFIRMVGKGEIKVEYDQQGEISKVESRQGAKMALAVTEAFQTLLRAVKVASAEM